MRRASLGLLAAIFLLPAPAWPCSVVGPLPSADVLVRRSDVIVRVTAESAAPLAVQTQSGTEVPSHVSFTVLEILKGELPSRTLRFNGVASDRDDRNDSPMPYEFVRPAGRHGNCYALEYRIGAEYLLLLKRNVNEAANEPTLTPYWSALSPTNEQLFGGQNDPWFGWVRELIADGQRREPAVQDRAPAAALVVESSEVETFIREGLKDRLIAGDIPDIHLIRTSQDKKVFVRAELPSSKTQITSRALPSMPDIELGLLTLPEAEEIVRRTGERLYLIAIDHVTVAGTTAGMWLGVDLVVPAGVIKMCCCERAAEFTQQNGAWRFRQWFQQGRCY